MLALAEQCADRQNAIRHYYHVGTRHWQWFLAKGDEAPAKKLFYAARPALCLRWMRVHGDRNVPPMQFQALLHEAETPVATLRSFEELVAAKAQTRELGYATVTDAIRNFIDSEFQCMEPSMEIALPQQTPDNVETARALFHEAVVRFSAR